MIKFKLIFLVLNYVGRYLLNIDTTIKNVADSIY